MPDNLQGRMQRRRAVYLQKQLEAAEAYAARLKLEQVEKGFERERKLRLGSTLTHSLGDALRASGFTK